MRSGRLAHALCLWLLVASLAPGLARECRGDPRAVVSAPSGAAFGPESLGTSGARSEPQSNRVHADWAGGLSDCIVLLYRLIPDAVREGAIKPVFQYVLDPTRRLPVLFGAAVLTLGLLGLQRRLRARGR